MAGSRSLRNSFEFCWGGSGLYDSPLEEAVSSELVSEAKIPC